MTTAWDAELYAANTAHHRRHDDEFLGDLALPAGARVLDVGCGVGDLTARLAALGPDVDVLGVDADPGMVAGAAARFGSDRLRFAVGRAQELAGIVPAGSVDAVFSMAALHWVPAAEHPAVLAQVRRVLRPGGLLRAQFGGHGQIGAVRSLLDAESARLGGGPAGWFFPTAERYADLLATAGFAVPPAAGPGGWVRLVRQRRGFPTAGELVGWLRSQAFPAYDPVLPDGTGPAFRAAAEDRAVTGLRRADGTYDLDFVRLDLLVRPA